jgi:hypothetical protein
VALIAVEGLVLAALDVRLEAATSTQLNWASSPRVALEIIGGTLGGKIAVAAEVLPSETILCRVSQEVEAMRQSGGER